MGDYDIVAVTDFPDRDEETGVASMLKVSSLGHVRTNTLRAFNADEMAAIIRRAGKGGQLSVSAARLGMAGTECRCSPPLMAQRSRPGLP